MSTQMTTRQHGAPATTGHLGIEGLEGLSQQDVILPRWSLIQPTSRKEGADEHVGQFQRNLDGAFREHLDAVILMIQPSRLLWAEDQSERRPECFSRDGVVGSVYGDCATCRFNVQANRDLLAEIRAGGSPRTCSYGYNLVLVDDVAEESAALLGAMGTSVRPAKTLISQFATKRTPPFAHSVRIDSERQVNDRGKFYILKFTLGPRLGADEAAKWREMYLSLKGATISDIEEGDATPPAPAEDAF